jgi:hypothetical protein
MRYNPHKALKAHYRTTPKRKDPEPAPAPKPEPSAPAVNGVPILTENSEKDGYELKFPGKPTEAVLGMFRETKTLPAENRWHWHFKKKVWYAKRNEATREFAQLVISQSSGLGEVIPQPAPVEPVAPGQPNKAASVTPEPAPALETEKEYTDRAVMALLSGRSGVIPPKPAEFAEEPIHLPVEHATFSRPEWALEVQNGDTRLGYEEWVEAKIELAGESAAEVPEQEQVIPGNVLPVTFAPPEDDRTKAAVNQSPLPDWRSTFSWTNRQRARERGELPGQSGYGRFQDRENR